LQPIYNNNPSLNQENIDIEELLEILERLADDYLNSQRNVAKLAIFSQLNREPITDAAPEYPRRAARQDVEGEVTLTYSINLLGEIVDNSINVTAANPEGYFEEVSIEALEKRSFEPLEVPAFIQSYGNVININQLQLSNLQQTFRFDLE